MSPDTFLAPDQVTDLVKTGVAEGVAAALKAINTPVDRPGEGSPATVTTPPTVNFGRPQRPSFVKALKASRSGNWKGAELERDIAQATAEKFGGDPENPASFWMPTTPMAYADVLWDADIHTEARKALGEYAIKAMAEGTNSVTYGNTTGALLVPVEFLQNEFTLALTSAVALRKIPSVRTVPVNSNVVQLPRETAVATTTSIAEAGTLVSSDPTLAGQSFTVQKQYAYRTFSNELLRDATPSLDQYIMSTLARDLALYQDKEFIAGVGTSNHMYGLRNYSGNVTNGTFTTSSWSAPTNGGTMGADDVVKLIWDIRKANAEMDAFIMHPRTAQEIMLLKDATGRYIFSDQARFGGPVLNPGSGTQFTYPSAAVGSILGIPVYLSTQVSIAETQGTASTSSYIIYGDFRHALILERQALEIATSEHVAFNTDQTAVRAITRSVLAVTQPLAFAVATGIL